MDSKRNRRRVRSGETAIITESSSDSDKNDRCGYNHLRRSRRFQRIANKESLINTNSAYDGDGETTCSTYESSCNPTMSSTSSDMYDFNEADITAQRSILSPKQPKVKRKSSKTNVGKINMLKPTKSKRISYRAVKSVTPVIAKAKLTCENKPIRKLPGSVHTPGLSPILTSSPKSSKTDSNKKMSKRKMSNLANDTPVIAAKSSRSCIGVIRDDSGFSSPPLKVARITNKDTSTPSNNSDCVTSQGNKKYSEFGTPIDQIMTSDYGSAVLDLSQISMDDADPYKNIDVEMFTEPVTEEVDPDISLNKSVSSPYTKLHRKKRPKGRYSISKIESWADKMNQEFEDADNYELSIEG